MLRSSSTAAVPARLVALALVVVAVCALATPAPAGAWPWSTQTTVRRTVYIDHAQSYTSDYGALIQCTGAKASWGTNTKAGTWYMKTSPNTTTDSACEVTWTGIPVNTNVRFEICGTVTGLTWNSGRVKSDITTYINKPGGAEDLRIFDGTLAASSSTC